jgi:hypothetical protein
VVISAEVGMSLRNSLRRRLHIAVSVGPGSPSEHIAQAGSLRRYSLRLGCRCRFVLIGGAALFPTTDSRLSALSPKTPRTLEARPNWGGSFPMANRSEAEKILEVAVAGKPRIAKVIADFPIEFREGALEVAERRYQQTVCDLGYAEGDAQGWISVVMFRLRRQVADLSTKKLEGSGSEAERALK